MMLVPGQGGQHRLSPVGNQACGLVEVDIREDPHYHVLTERAG